MDRRLFLASACGLTLGTVAGKAAARARKTGTSAMDNHGVKLFLCGDVMTARGIDQVLPHPGNPVLHEAYVKSAARYVASAVKANGPIPRPVPFDYVWGDALSEWSRMRPDVRIVNLETSVTTRDDWQRGKGIHYRMNPANLPCLTAAGIDCCVLANNHVLDWGYAGLEETLATLRGAGIRTAGAGRDQVEAAAPAVLPIAGKGRVLVFSLGLSSSGIPADWAAGVGRAGVNLLADLTAQSLRRIAAQVKAVKRTGDVVVASIHWGGNWGYAVPGDHTRFAHGLIDHCAVDVVHGHSSHHPLGIEIYRERPILYGCGDFLNDYEGIRGHEAYRSDLSLMYFLRVDPGSGKLLQLEMVPMQIRRFRLKRASTTDSEWLHKTLHRESLKLGSRVESNPHGSFALRWGN